MQFSGVKRILFENLWKLANVIPQVFKPSRKKHPVATSVRLEKRTGTRWAYCVFGDNARPGLAVNNVFHNNLPLCNPDVACGDACDDNCNSFQHLSHNVPCILHFSDNRYSRNSPIRKYTSYKYILHNNIPCRFCSCHWHRLGVLWQYKQLTKQTVLIIKSSSYTVI